MSHSRCSPVLEIKNRNVSFHTIIIRPPDTTLKKTCIPACIRHNLITKDGMAPVLCGKNLYYYWRIDYFSQIELCLCKKSILLIFVLLCYYSMFLSMQVVIVLVCLKLSFF